MMTVRSISSDGAADHTSYLQSKTVAPEWGGRWLGARDYQHFSVTGR